MKILTVFLAGGLFGFGLAISGMTNPAKVLAFLDPAGSWDPTLAFVMAGALGTYAAGMRIWRRATGGRGWFGNTLPAAAPAPINRRLIFGAAIFGVGWGLAGFCPGPAIANLAALRPEALVFVPMMLVGMLAARWAFRAT